MDLTTRPSGWTAPSRRTIPLNSPWCRWRLSASSLGRSTCSFKLICSSPGFAVLNKSHDSTIRSGPTLSRPDQSASMARHPVGVCQIAVLREALTIFRTRVRSTLRTLEFWLFIRLDVSLYDVFNLSSISIDVLDLLLISIDVLQPMFLPSCQSQPMFFTCSFRSCRAADLSPLCDPKTPSSTVLR